MNNLMIFGLIALYISGGVFYYGLSFAFWQRNWPSIAEKEKPKDQGDAFFGAFLWPMGLLALALTVGFGDHGFKGFKFK